MIHFTKPENFKADMNVAGCILRYNDEILLLIRQEWKSEAWKMWFPWWKVDTWESLEQAVIREAQEETTIILQDDKPTFIKTARVDYEWWKNVQYSMFEKILDEKPEVTIDPTEHSGYKRINIHEFTQDNEEYMEYLYECLQIYIQIK